MSPNRMKNVASALWILTFFCACQSTPKNTLSATSYPHADSIKLGLVQYPMRGNLKAEGFFKKMSAYIQRAAEKKATVVFFPEYVGLDLWPLGSKEKENVILQNIAKELDKVYLDFLKNEALKHKIWIIGGTYPRIVDGKIFNSSPILSPVGELVLQDKMFLTHWERKMNVSSGETLQLVKGPWGLGVVLICYDVEFPQITQHLSAVTENLNLIFVPSETETEAGLQRVLKTAAARSVEHHTYTAVSAIVGKVSADWEHFGESTVFSPEDKAFSGALFRAPKNTAGIHFTDLNFTPLVQGKRESRFYPAKDQRQYPVKVRNN